MKKTVMRKTARDNPFTIELELTAKQRRVLDECLANREAIYDACLNHAYSLRRAGKDVTEETVYACARETATALERKGESTLEPLLLGNIAKRALRESRKFDGEKRPRSTRKQSLARTYYMSAYDEKRPIRLFTSPAYVEWQPSCGSPKLVLTLKQTDSLRLPRSKVRSVCFLRKRIRGKDKWFLHIEQRNRSEEIDVEKYRMNLQRGRAAKRKNAFALRHGAPAADLTSGQRLEKRRVSSKRESGTSGSVWTVSGGWNPQRMRKTRR